MFTLLTMISYVLIVTGYLKIGFAVALLSSLLGIQYGINRQAEQLILLQIFFTGCNLYGLFKVGFFLGG